MTIAPSGFSGARKSYRAFLLALIMAVAASPVYASSSGFSSLSASTPFSGLPDGTSTPVTIFTMNADSLSTSFAGPVLLTGWLGIGTTSPDTPLHIDDIINNTAIDMTYQNGAYHHQIGIISSATANQNEMYFKVSSSGSNTVQVMTLQGDGSVGIGTASPQSQLDIAVSSFSPNAGIHISTPGEDEYALMINNTQYGNSNGTGFGFWESNTGTAGIDVNKNHVIYITPAALVGIGSSAPQGTFDVENGSNGASLCMNGNCVNQLPAVFALTIAQLARYNTLCAGTTTDAAGSLSAYCVSACNRYCSNACHNNNPTPGNCNGTPNSGRNYVAGTLIEGSSTSASCACF